MSSVTLEAAATLAITLTVVILAYSYTATVPTQACTLSYSPLTQINDAIQAAYAQPYAQVVVPLNATLTVIASGNQVGIRGCEAPPPTIADPDRIVKTYTSNEIEYSVLFAPALISTPAILVAAYNPQNKTLTLTVAT